MLKSQILKIPTKWKDIILDYITNDELLECSRIKICR